MAFDKRNLQLARAQLTTFAQGAGITSAEHSYKSSTDTLATIQAPGYFPDSIGEPESIFVDDTLFIKGTDGAALVVITATTPMTFGFNLINATPLEFEEFSSPTNTWTLAFTSPPTARVDAQRFNKGVRICVGNMGNSRAGGAVGSGALSTAIIPLSFRRPGYQPTMACQVINNNAGNLGQCAVNAASSALTVSASVTGSNFAATPALNRVFNTNVYYQAS